MCEMENIDQRLKAKTIHANKLEYFVFLPNNLTDIKYIAPDINANPIFCEAIAVKNEGNSCFEDKQYDDAILHYNRAIDMFEEINTKSCAPQLGVCYQNRATANAFKKNYVDAISDASKAIQLNEHYAKAYYRRAKCYFDQKKYYRALQDIVQACILERFKNPIYNSTVVEIITGIDLDPLASQWKKAYDEMDSVSVTCDHCLKQQITFVRQCGVLDPISVPYPWDQPVTGYLRSMKGINETYLDEIMAGCEEEKSSNGQYLAQSYILKAYMNSVVIQSSSYLQADWQQDVQRMNEIISATKYTENIKHQAKLCRANLYNCVGLYQAANCDLNSLEKQYSNNGLFHVIKSGALFQFALSNRNFLEPLVKCSRLLPNIYELQFQTIRAQTNYIVDPIASTARMLASLDHLTIRFPTELAPRILLIALYIELDIRKATSILKQARKDFPNRLDELISMDGLLNLTNPSCVEYFKRALRLNKDDLNSFQGLLEYFSLSTCEYAKAIEVSTAALRNFLREDDFKSMFEHRQLLLKKIIRQHFWEKL